MKMFLRNLKQILTKTTNISSSGSKQFAIVRSDITSKTKQGVQLGHASVLGFYENLTGYAEYDYFKSPHSCSLIYLQVPNKLILHFIAWYVSIFYRYKVSKFYESGDREKSNNGLTAISFYANICEYSSPEITTLSRKKVNCIKYTKGHPVRFLKKWEA